MGTVLAAIIAGVFLLISTDKIVIPKIVIPTPAPIAATGTIEDVTVEHNVEQASQQGMRMHVKFTIQNRQSIKCAITAYFHFADGTPVRDQNGSYKTLNGNVAVGSSFKPRYTSTRYYDFQLFLPYDELHMDSGTHDLNLVVQLYDPIYKRVIVNIQ